MKRLAIIGAGDLGQLIAHHAIRDDSFQVAGFFDDGKRAGTKTPYGLVMGTCAELEELHHARRFDCLLVGIGYNHMSVRQACFQRYAQAVPFAKLIHSSCQVDPSARVGEGCVLLPGCVLDMGVSVKPNSLLNTGCTIAHDTTVEENCFLGPGVTLAGFVTLRSGCYIGVGTIVIDNIEVASGVQTGAGAVVTRNIREPGLYVGVPARKVDRGSDPATVNKETTSRCPLRSC